jgi:hypothetical protein
MIINRNDGSRFAGEVHKAKSRLCAQATTRLHVCNAGKLERVKKRRFVGLHLVIRYIFYAITGKRRYLFANKVSI